MKRYTPKVEQGLKYAIAMLEIDAEHIQNSVKSVALILDEDAPPPKLSAEDKKQMEEYRAAAEWLRGTWWPAISRAEMKRAMALFRQDRRSIHPLPCHPSKLNQHTCPRQGQMTRCCRFGNNFHQPTLTIR